MAEISAGLVKELRELTGLGMMECKKALAECAGDLKKAEELLRIKSGAKASKAASRVAAEGVLGAWLAADGKVGALVELNAETDFVAKNEDFIAFARDVAMQIAATPSLRYVSREDVPEDVRDAEARIYEQEAADKPENVRERIVSGKLDAWMKTVVVLEQEMHNPKFEGKTVQQLRDELTANTGENVVIRRFARFAVGQ